MCKDVNNIFYALVPLIHRLMQQLEDTLNVSLCGHFLIMLATMCLAAFSAVTVRYKLLYVVTFVLKCEALYSVIHALKSYLIYPVNDLLTSTFTRVCMCIYIHKNK